MEEFCGNCAHCRFVEDEPEPGDVSCSGACGITVPGSVANVSGLWLTTGAAAVSIRSWYCARCRNEPRRPVANEEASDQPVLPELPPEVWIEIFTYLSAQKLLPVRVVCRRWRDLVDGSAALVGKFALAIDWNENDVRRNWNTMPEYLPPAVSRISFRAAKRIGSWWHSYGPGMAEIKIEHKYNTSQISDLLKLLKHAPNLKRFEMERGFLEGKCPTGVGFRLDQLEKLDIACVHQCGKYLKVFRELCRNVRSLKFMWHAGEETADPQGLAAYVGELQDTLEELAVNCCEEFLVPVMTHERLKLKKLTLLWEGVVKDELLVEFLRKQPALEHLNLVDMLHFGEENSTMLIEIGKLLLRLKFLSIYATHVDTSFLHGIADLQTLELCADCSKFTLILPNSIGERRRSNLRKLNLHQIHLPDNCIRQWLPTLPNLSTLIIISCKIDQWPDLLIALNQLPLLTHLTLKYCQITSPIAPTCTNPATLTLKYLHFFANNGESPQTECLIALLKMSPDLRELQLQDLPLTEGIFGVIFQYQRALKTLIADAGLSREPFTDDYIRQNCPSLEELDVYETGPLKFL